MFRIGRRLRVQSFPATHDPLDNVANSHAGMTQEAWAPFKQTYLAKKPLGSMNAWVGLGCFAFWFVAALEICYPLNAFFFNFMHMYVPEKAYTPTKSPNDEE